MVSAVGPTASCSNALKVRAPRVRLAENHTCGIAAHRAFDGFRYRFGLPKMLHFCTAYTLFLSTRRQVL